MPCITLIENPFEPMTHRQVEVIDGTTVYDYLCAAHGGKWEAFDKPTIVIVNGKKLFQADYPLTALQANDSCSIVAVPGYEAIYFLIILIVVAVAVTFAQQPPAIAETDTDEGKSVYSLSGRDNEAKLGAPVPCCYGLVRNWPDRAAEPYQLYQDNNQYIFIILCAGHGKNVLTDPKVNNTPFSSFKEISYEIVEPFGYVSLFRDKVITIPEVANLEIFGPNEDDYDGPIGPFIINDFDESIDRIECDFSFPKGLFFQNDGGSLGFREIEGYFEYRQIDEDGDGVFIPGELEYYNEVKEYKQPFGSSFIWRVESTSIVIGAHPYADGYKVTTIITEGGEKKRVTKYYVSRVTEWTRVIIAKELKTIDPQRFTMSVDVPLGRYEVRFDRTNDKDLSFKASNDFFVDTVRGFMPNRTFYGDKTMVAVKALATANLNSNSANKLNFAQQRWVEVWDSELEEWTERQETRNPVWAACDAVRAQYGGRYPASILDLVTLSSLAETFDTLGITFDYMFAQSGNLWDILKTILSVGHAMPVLNGSKISAVRDYLQVLPETIFTPDNMLPASFSWNMVLRKLNDYDSVEVEYTDEDTFKQETIPCLIGDDAGENPEKLKLVGVTNRNRAYRMGMRQRATKKFRKELGAFKTDMQGHIPSLNSMVAVVHDVPRWGQSGLVESFEDNVLTLNRDHTFDPEEIYVIILKQRSGYASQIYFITYEATTTNVVTVTDLDISLERLGDEEPLIYVLGLENQITKYLRIVGITPNDYNEISIDWVNNDNRIYDYEAVEAPTKEEAILIGAVSLPEIESLSVHHLVNDLTKIQATWSFTPGAVSYVLEYSYDDIVYTQAVVTEATLYVLPVHNGTLYLRVAAINEGQGPWKTWTGTVGVAINKPNNVTGLALVSPFIGTAVYLKWNAVPTAVNYIVYVYRTSDEALLGTYSTTIPTFTYGQDLSQDDFGIDGHARELTFEVVAENAAGESVAPTSLAVSNPVPSSVDGINFEILQETADFWEIKIFWDDYGYTAPGSDRRAVRVYASETTGFTPGPSNLIHNSLGTFVIFTVSKVTSPTHYYFRVVAIDFWGFEETNISTEQDITLP